MLNKIKNFRFYIYLLQNIFKYSKCHYVMYLKKEKLLLTSAIFLFSFLFMLSLTYNFNFFWEDIIYLDQYEKHTQNPQDYTSLALMNIFFNSLIEQEQFYQIKYRERPLEKDFIYPLLVALYGVQVSHYRLGIAFLFGIFMVLCSTFFYRLGEQLIPASTEKLPFSPSNFFNPPVFLSILLCLYFIVLPTTWVMILYLVDDLLLSLTFTTASLLLFYFFYTNDTIKNKYVLTFLLFLIIFFTKISMLINHIGRINIFIIFLFLLFTDRQKLTRIRYILLLIILLFLSFPILGLPRLLSGQTIFDIIGLTSHVGTQDMNFFFFLSDFIKTFHYSFLPHALFPLLLFFLFFILHLYAFCLKKESKEPNTKIIQELRALLLFSLFWFILSAFIFYAARGFLFEPYFFTSFEMSLFIVPQILFVIGYCLFIYKKYFPEKKFFLLLIYVFLIVAILHNVLELNHWRGGWGAYFLGYDTAQQYVDEHEENAILLLPLDHASPTYFIPPSTNKHNMVADLTNTSLLHSYQQNYSAIYIANRIPLTFDDPSIVSLANLTIIDNSPYGWFKRILGAYYPMPIYLYKVEE